MYLKEQWKVALKNDETCEGRTICFNRFYISFWLMAPIMMLNSFHIDNVLLIPSNGGPSSENWTDKIHSRLKNIWVQVLQSIIEDICERQFGYQARFVNTYRWRRTKWGGGLNFFEEKYFRLNSRHGDDYGPKNYMTIISDMLEHSRIPELSRRVLINARILSFNKIKYPVIRIDVLSPQFHAWTGQSGGTTYLVPHAAPFW
jgi:hypothetical protein